MRVNISFPYGEVMNLNGAIVPIHIPFLHGPDAMRKYGFPSREKLIGIGGWSLPLIHEHGFAFVLPDGPISELPKTCMEYELQKLNFQFFHLSTGKLLKVLAKIRPRDTLHFVIQIQVSEVCPMCYELHVTRFRLRLSLLEYEIAFNRVVDLELIFLSERPLLHVIECDMWFQTRCY